MLLRSRRIAIHRFRLRMLAEHFARRASLSESACSEIELQSLHPPPNQEEQGRSDWSARRYQ
jgi:hypothetical protein